MKNKSTKILIGIAGVVGVVAIIVATAWLTATLVNRSNTNEPFAPGDATEAVTFPEQTNPDIDPTLVPYPNAAPTQAPQPPAQNNPPPTQAPQQPPTQNNPIPTQAPAHNRNNRPTNPPVSRAQAIDIANAYLAQQGISAQFRADSGMDWERGRWVWELEFRGGGMVYEFYIDVNTGEIVKFEAEIWD